MQKYWTISHPSVTSLRLHKKGVKFLSLADAVQAAVERLETDKVEEVHIRECVKVVKFSKPPIVLEDTTGPRVETSTNQEEPETNF